MDFPLSQPNESAGYIMEISPDSIITHLTAVSLVLLNLFLNSTGQVEGVRGICICLQFSCKQGVPYKEPQKNPVLRNAKPSDGLLGRGQIPHGTDCCVPYDETGHSRLYAARYRNVHTRVTNILPLFQSILGANFRLFLRFKGPASKWTGISPRGRLGAPPFPKTRSGVLQHILPCSNMPYPAATCPSRTHRT